MPHSSLKPNRTTNSFSISPSVIGIEKNIQYRLNHKSKGLLRFRRSHRPVWSKNPGDILESVPKKLPLVDILQCLAVCNSWRSITQTYKNSSLNSPPNSSLPPLIIWRLPCTARYNSYWFLDVTAPAGALYQLNESKRILGRLGPCVGFSHGWFIFLNRKGKYEDLCLFHPLLFPQAVARFPRLSTPDRYLYKSIVKVVLWAEPLLSSANYGVVAMFGGSNKKLMFAKPGATQFSELEYGVKATGDDIICFKNRIYGVSSSCRGQYLSTWEYCTGDNFVDPPRKVLDCELEFSDPESYPTRWSTLHLVELQGELLLVSIQRPSRTRMEKLRNKLRIFSWELYALARCPDMCIVYKMDFDKEEWVQMNSLGEHALFITDIRNTSVSTHEFPQYKRNTVYFQHIIDIIGCDHVVGVFNLEDGSMEEIHTERLRTENRLHTH